MDDIHTTIKPRTNIAAVAEKDKPNRYAINGVLPILGKEPSGWLAAEFKADWNA